MIGAINQTPFVVGSYIVTLGGIALYTWRLLLSARKAARQVPRKDRPWT